MLLALIIAFLVLCFLGTAYYKVQELREYRRMAQSRKSLDFTNLGPDRPDAPTRND